MTLNQLVTRAKNGEIERIVSDRGHQPHVGAGQG